MGLGALRLCVGRRVTTLGLELERTPHPPFISRFVARDPPHREFPATHDASKHQPRLCIYAGQRTATPSGIATDVQNGVAYNTRSLAHILPRQQTSTDPHPHANDHIPTRAASARGCPRPSSGPGQPERGVCAGAVQHGVDSQRHNARGESCMLSPLALCRCESPGWLSEHSAMPALAPPPPAYWALGIVGAKPSSRVRMFMNSSPVMVSFFCR